jgi:deoxyribodipyrimidine photo-lyase
VARQILWFRRDLRISDNAILTNAKDEVLPIFIFDKNILEKLDNDDKRVTFIYQSVLNLKQNLQSMGLNLAIFHDTPKNVFENLKSLNFDEVLCSVDFDEYAINRDNEIEKIMPMKRFLDSYIINPQNILKKDNTPYKVFTPFYKSLSGIWEANSINEYQKNPNLKSIKFNYENNITLESLGFIKQELPQFLYQNPKELLKDYCQNIKEYNIQRDFFGEYQTSNMAVFLRFGLISPREILNIVRQYQNSQDYIRELFWREFYNYILFHFPNSQKQNFNGVNVKWENNHENFEHWKNGTTGVPIIDASIIYFNKTGLMHNRLRMIVSSFLTKNLLIDWKRGEEYFAKKLLDYDASSNIGSWQWAASTGADSVPYFRIFNPYLQSAKFDKEAVFIKSQIPQLKDIDPKLIHKESGLNSGLFSVYKEPIVSIEFSRKQAIQRFKEAKG